MVAYADRPGVMGTVGALLGEQQINIEAAQISQELDGQAAIMVLRVDRVPGSGPAGAHRRSGRGQGHPGDRRSLTVASRHRRPPGRKTARADTLTRAVTAQVERARTTACTPAQMFQHDRPATTQHGGHDGSPPRQRGREVNDEAGGHPR